MTDKQIIEQRPVCLYQDTCLHLKEKTRVCEDCIHHKNYWSELLAKDQAEKIKSLEQECERLKRERDSWEYQWEKRCEIGEYLSEQLNQLKSENEELKEKLKSLQNK